MQGEFAPIWTDLRLGISIGAGLACRWAWIPILGGFATAGGERRGMPRRAPWIPILGDFQMARRRNFELAHDYTKVG